MKKQIIIGFILLVFGSVRAKETNQYLYFNVGGGQHSLVSNLNNGIQNGRLGYAINAGYSYFFTSHLGLQTGIGLQSFGSMSTLNFLSKTPNVIDADGDPYEYRLECKNWQERQRALLVDFPLELVYRYSYSKKIDFQASAGAKISIPVQGGYKTIGGEMETTGYYSQWNVILNNLPQHGFSNNTSKYTGDLYLKTSYSLLLDLGGLYKVSDKLHVYFGAYLNYGLNNFVSGDSKLLYQPDGVYNGVFGSDQARKVTPLGLGFKVGGYWGIGSEYKKRSRPIRIKREHGGNYIFNKIDSSDSVSKLTTKNEIDHSANILVESEASKSNQIQKKSISEKSIEDAKKIVAKMNFNIEPSSVLKRLNIDNVAMRKLRDILKEDTNAILYILSQSDSSSIASVVNRRKLQTSVFTEHAVADTITQNNLTDNDTLSTTFPLGFSAILRLLNAKIESVEALNDILKADPSFSANILSQHDFTSVNVASLPHANITTDAKSIDSLDSDGDGIPDSLDRCPNLAGVKLNHGCPETRSEGRMLFNRKLTNIQFEKGSCTIMPRFYSILDQISTLLVNHPSYWIEVQGHADSDGNSQSNKLLSELRAFVVRYYMVKKGVDCNRITTTGFGDTMPISTNATSQGKALNRRVEFVITSEGENPK